MGQAVIRALNKRNHKIRTVTQRSDIDAEVTETVTADLLDSLSTDEAIKGSHYAYMCAGLPYSTRVWQKQWPVIMRNIIAACSKHDTRLIFLDNTYMYAAPLPTPFAEDVPQHPTTGKGKARKETPDLMVDAMSDGRIKGLIGRSTGFYEKNPFLV